MRFLRAWMVVALVMLLLDLSWIGLVAKPLYDIALHAIKAEQVNGLAALLFYVFYVSATVFQAVLPAQSFKDALKRGAAMGLIAYGTWDLTNWAVLKDFQPWIVPIDMAWGTFLTGLCAGAGWRLQGT